MRTYKDYKEALFSISYTLHNRVKPMYLRHVEDKWLDVLQELVDKATPKAPIVEQPKTKYYGSCLSKNLVFNVCPTCGNLLGDVKVPYCNRCGQALDWSEEDGKTD